MPSIRKGLGTLYLTNNLSVLNRVYLLIVIIALLVFLLSLVFPLLTDDGSLNLYVLQAKAFLEGRTDIHGVINDTAVYNGKNYVPFPPFPAVLLLPLCAVFDTVNTTLVSLLLTLVIGFLFWKIFEKLNIDKKHRIWLILAFIMGTGYWFVVQSSFGVWSFAHVVATTFSLLALREALSKGRGYLAGLLLGCAILSRQLLVYTSVFMLVALLTNSNNASKAAGIKCILGFAGVLSIIMCIYFYFNALRFSGPFDTGYAYIVVPEQLAVRVEQFGLFNKMYIPFNFFYMFIQGPHFVFKDSMLPGAMDPYGTSLTFASPFLLFSFLARGNRLLLAGCWIAISACIIHMLFYYNNGWVQINTQRFALDFIPLLMILVALSIKTAPKKLLYAAAGYAMLLNTLALFLMPLAKIIAER